MEPYVLGIDIGTGSMKAVAIHFSGEPAYHAQVQYPTLQPHPSFSEQEPDVIYKAFVNIIRDTVKKMGTPPSAISLSSAMHGVIAVDAEGHALSNLILWSDARSASIAAALRASAEGALIYHHTGTPVHSMSPLCKIIWMRQHLPSLFNESAKFISIKEYIWWQLFHEFRIDHSIASATGLFDIEKLSWHPAALELAGITGAQLSEPVPTHYSAVLNNQTAAALHLPVGIPFYIGASDGCLANVGSHALDQHVAAITIGTSGAVRIARNEPLRDYFTMSFNYILDEHTFICGGPVNNGGNVIQWLLKNFLQLPSAGEHEYNELFDRIESVPAGCNGLIFLPYLFGARAPVWDEQSCGVFFGMNHTHDQSFFLRAAVEGLCFSLCQVLSSVENATEPVSHIHVSGGFVHSSGWMQLLADITGRQVAVHQTEDGSAIGAAVLAIKAHTKLSDYSSLRRQAKQFFYPREEFARAYRKNYSVFLTLYPNLVNSMHLLHDLNS